MLSRRGFILSGAAVGGGLVIGYGYVALDDGDAASKFAAAGQPAIPLNAWLKIAANGTVTCGIHRAEMGQGITTTLAMLLVEELDADWNDVRFEFVPVDRDYFNFGMLLNGQPLGDPEASWRAATGTWAIREAFHALGMSMTIASSSTVDAWDTLPPAGAAARQMLLAAAAREWGTGISALRTERGYVYDDANNRKLSYGKLAEQAGKESPPDSVELKDPADYRLVGHNPPRLDAPMKIDGSAQFGIDIQLPDMLYATVVHSPVVGTNIAGFSGNGAEAMPGVHSIVSAGAPGFERAVAVVADSSWQALQAAAKVTVVPAPASSELVNSDALRARYRELLDVPSPVIFSDSASDGDDANDDSSADDKSAFDELMLDTREQRVTADYAVPFLAHLCMEPMNCTALYTTGAAGAALEIWAPTQANSVARDIAAKMSGLDNSQVMLHTTFMGGGFGRRADMDFVEQAVSVALQVPNRPVKLFWSREQDVRHDAFRPAASCRISGALDANGNLSVLDYKLVTQSVVASYETRTPTPRGGDAQSDKSVVTAVNPPIYSIENLRVGFTPIDLHMPAGYWRSVSHSWNSFFIESFIDELAVAANMQPLAFRRQALAAKPRHLRVLNAVAARIVDSGADRAADSTAAGVGFAVTESHTTVVAHAVEVAVLDGRFDRVVRVVCAVDCGPVVHPDNVKAQIEGSIVDGLSAALYGQIDVENGAVVQGNFDTYRRMRINACPVIEVIIIDSEQRRPGGVGEPGLPGAAPALVNAIFAATGERIRSLPLG
jgi:isoquinoline 1-oxidoreductase beta subunit